MRQINSKLNEEIHVMSASRQANDEATTERVKLTPQSYSSYLKSYQEKQSEQYKKEVKQLIMGGVVAFFPTSIGFGFFNYIENKICKVKLHPYADLKITPARF